MAEAGAVKVLLVEDDEDDYFITRDLLGQQDRTRFELDWCSDFQTAMSTIIEGRHAVYLIDYRLGAPTGLELVRAGFTGVPWRRSSSSPARPTTRSTSRPRAIGVTDFLLKQELNPLSLERSIRYAVSHHQALHGAGTDARALCPRGQRRERRHLGLEPRDRAGLPVAPLAGPARSSRIGTARGPRGLVRARAPGRPAAAGGGHRSPSGGRDATHRVGAPHAPRGRIVAMGADPRPGHS